jgi:exodeoxyribonuclease V beta subunit
MSLFRVPKPVAFPDLEPKHWVLEASAGTGKTYTLEHLVVELVLEARLPLEQIVIVTFTEAAALELRRRIRGKLQELRDLREDRFEAGRAHWALDDGARALLDEALQAFDRTVISTIHAFCQKVLQDAAFENGRLFRQTRMAEGELFSEVFKAHLRAGFGGTDGDRAFLEEALQATGSPEELEALLYGAWSARAALYPDAQDLARARAAVRAFPRPDLRDTEALRTAFGKSAKPILDRLALLDPMLPSLQASETLANWTIIVENDLFEKPSDKKKWLQALWDSPLPDGPAARVRAGLQALKEALPTVEGLIVHRLLPPLEAAMKVRKASEGLFDFNDMIDQVAEGVTHPELVARLRQRYKAALMDEFQDTDGRQWDIFRRVFHGPEHRLVLIGDPKQAIYDFRGGDLPTYLRASREILASGGRKLVLTQNFRSSLALIQAVNAVLTPEGGFFQAPNEYPDPVTPGRPGTRLTGPGGDLPPLRLLEVPATGAVGRLRTRVAAGLAAVFRDLLDSGAVFHPGTSDPARPLQAGDLMVLTHTGAESRLMAQALREAGLPSAFFKADGLFQTREALELQDLLGAILWPDDPDARGRALLTRFFGFDLSEAEACLDLPAGHPVLARLERWRELALQRRYPRLFNALLEESGIVPRLLITERGDRALTNLNHLVEHLLSEATGAHLDPEDLFLRLRRWIHGEDLPAVEAEPGIQRAEGEAQAVRILTIHKAKGLEAPVVALFGGYGDSQSNTARIHRFHDAQALRSAFLGSPGALPADIRHRVRSDAEREAERLLYVAITRPKVQLVLPLFTPGPEPPSARGSFDAEGHPKGPHGLLNRRMKALRDSEASPFAGWVAPLPPPVERAAACAVQALPPRIEPLPIPAPPDFAGLARRGRPLQLHSFTSLSKAFGEPLRAASREEESRADEVIEPRPRPAGGLPGGTATGSALHELLERIPPGQTRRMTAEAWREAHLPLAAECLAGQGLNPSLAAEALRLAWTALTTDVPLPGGATVRLDGLSRRLPEVAFQMPFPGHPDGLEGSLDLLFEWEDRLYVLDWKTNSLDGGDYGPDALARTMATHYDLQVRIYTLATLAFAGIQDAAAFEARWGGAVYVFLRGLPSGGLWTHRPTWEDILAWRRELEALRIEERALSRMERGMHG